MTFILIICQLKVVNCRLNEYVLMKCWWMLVDFITWRDMYMWIICIMWILVEMNI